MADDVARLPWTEDQWAAVQRVVHEAACKARLASSFLPLVGPLPPGQASVPALWMTPEPVERPQRGEATHRLEIDDAETLALTTLSCEVYLTTQQVEDPDLVSAKQLLGRAADLIGRLEDAIVFNGHPGGSGAPDNAPQPETYRVHVPRENPGLLTDQGLPDDLKPHPELALGVKKESSKSLVEQVGEAVSALEARGHYGPFACVLGHELYKTAIQPASSLALPRDRILPFLDGGPLHRSSVVPRDQGVVVSLAGSPIDLVVASDVHVKFVQVTLEPRYVLRVSERFVLRLKQPTARCRLVPEETLSLVEASLEEEEARARRGEAQA